MDNATLGQAIRNVLGMVYMQGGCDGTPYGNGKTSTENTQEATDIILDLFRGCVPEPLHQPQFPWEHANAHLDHWKASGFNKCREELLRKIN